MTLDRYDTILFDCDGVLLDSNKLKSDAFFEVARSHGDLPAKQFLSYHQEHGGISRNKKFDYFVSEILASPDMDTQPLLDEYAGRVKAGLVSCDAAEGLERLREQTPNAKWAVVSGGNQDELRDVFQTRGIAHLFDAGIFGSPDKKEKIVSEQLALGNFTQPAVLIGDSRYDCIVAEEFSLDFIFMTRWSEFSGWEEFFQDREYKILSQVSDLLK